MTPAVSAPVTSGRAAGGGRIQGVLVIAALALAVLATVALVVTPASSSRAATASPASSTLPSGPLPDGLRVEVQGGEALDAYALADRLTAAGASLQGVGPASSDDEVAGRTTIVYYDRRSMPAAERLRSMLGSGTLQRRQVFQPEVDVTIVLGKDLSRL